MGIVADTFKQCIQKEMQGVRNYTSNTSLLQKTCSQMGKKALAPRQSCWRRLLGPLANRPPTILLHQTKMVVDAPENCNQNRLPRLNHKSAMKL
jgi:hypothetical protein